MPPTARHMIRSTASNIAGQVLVMATWFALTPFVLHRLGASGYGLWVLIASLVAYGNLLDLGVGAAVTKYVAEYRARGESERASELIATALRMYCAIGLVVVVASIPFALVFPSLFNIRADQETTARWAVLLTAVALAVKLPSATAYAVLRGLQCFGHINLLSVSATIAQATATVGVLLLGGGVAGLAAISIPLTLLVQIPMQLVIRHVAPDLRFGWRGARRRLLGQVASFSGSLIVINSAGVVKTKTDEIVIGSALRVAAVAPYSIARRLSDLPTLLTYQFVRILFPLASELEGGGQRAQVRALFISGTRVTLALFVPIAVALMVLADPFLTAWVGRSYAGDADVAVILLAAALLEIAMWPAASLLQGTNSHRMLSVFSAGSAILNLGLSIALVSGVGVKGVALGTLIATGLEVLVVLPFAMRRYDVAPAVMLARALGPGLLPAAPATLVLFGLRAALDPSSLVTVVLTGALGGVVYAAGYLSFGATASERVALRRAARTTWQLARARG